MVFNVELWKKRNSGKWLALPKRFKEYKLPGRGTAQEPLLDIFFENHIKNRRGKLLKKEYIYLLRFQGDGATIKDTPLLNILAGGVYLHISVQKIVHCADQITGGHKNDAKFVLESFFDPINELDPEKNL